MNGLEDRNAELVEAVDIMQKTTRKNVLKLADVEKATSARLQETLREMMQKHAEETPRLEGLMSEYLTKKSCL